MTEPGGTVPVTDAGNWWQRRKTWQKVLIIVGAVIVALGIFGTVFGGSEASNEPVTSGDGTADTTTAAEAGLPGIGDAVRDGKLSLSSPQSSSPRPCISRLVR